MPSKFPMVTTDRQCGGLPNDPGLLRMRRTVFLLLLECRHLTAWKSRG
jgi:hypothetical protein